jgi:hypothetical protein
LRERRAAAAPGPRLKPHAENQPPGFSAYLAHAREAAPKAALTALNPGGPLLARDLWHGLRDALLARKMGSAKKSTGTHHSLEVKYINSMTFHKIY